VEEGTKTEVLKGTENERQKLWGSGGGCMPPNPESQITVDVLNDVITFEARL
jgi:hypothetical protein